MAFTKKTGSFEGKSNALGEGGRAAQLEAAGVPGPVIGNIARAKKAAPGQKNFHKGKHHAKKAAPKPVIPGASAKPAPGAVPPQPEPDDAAPGIGAAMQTTPMAGRSSGGRSYGGRSY
jgi:hypothetical protein